MNEASERTKQWMKDHPARTKELREAHLARKNAFRLDAVKALNRAEYKTPSKAIRAYCNECPDGISRPGFPLAPVTCQKKRCPLYAFRSCDPRLVKRAMRPKVLEQFKKVMRSKRKQEIDK